MTEVHWLSQKLLVCCAVILQYAQCFINSLLASESGAPCVCIQTHTVQIRAAEFIVDNLKLYFYDFMNNSRLNYSIFVILGSEDNTYSFVQCDQTYTRSYITSV